MKTVVVLSDSHRNTEAFDKLDTVLSECDYIIHLGDMVSDGRAWQTPAVRNFRQYVLNGVSW